MLKSRVAFASPSPSPFVTHLTLVIPGLAALPDEPLPGALAQLLSRANEIDTGLDLDSAIVMAAGVPRDTPIAPLAARGAGLDPGDAYTLRADPVTFVAGRDDVLLAGRVTDLAGDDAAALVARLNRHFEADGVVFHAPRADAWFVTARDAVPVQTHPLASIGGPIAPHLPQGDNGKTWRRWLSEMQMLLHGSEVNEKREAQGLAPVTGIWIASGGQMQRVSPSATIHAAPGYASDVARGLARDAKPAAAFADVRGESRPLVVTAPLEAATLAALDRDWIAPALEALDRRTLHELVVIGDGGGRTRQWTARPAGWWQRVRTLITR
jgi:hypothetical protein